MKNGLSLRRVPCPTVPLAGLEPATHGLGNHCSIQPELQGQMEWRISGNNLRLFSGKSTGIRARLVEILDF